MRKYFDFVFQEPLIPFAVIGGILFAAYGFQRPAQQEVIRIDAQTLRALEDFEVELRGRPLTDEDRKLLIESHIEDEVLMREAFRQELEQKDSRVRKRLLSVMRSSLDEAVPEPTTSQLQAFYESEWKNKEPDLTFSFDHVFFSFGSEPKDTQSLLVSLNDGLDHRTIGDQSFIGTIVNEMTANEIRRSLGNEFLKKLSSLETDAWYGPIDSGSGIHFVKLTAKGIEELPSFQQMESYLRQEWMFKKRREVQTRKIGQMKQRYQIELSDQDSDRE